MSELFEGLPESIKRKPGFASCEPSSNQGRTNTWFTPPWILQRLGRFDLDPCTVSTRPFATAGSHIEHDRGFNGLHEKWGGRVWLNPPYGRGIGVWLERLKDHGDGVALVFARTDAAWAQAAMRKAYSVMLLRGRVQFLNEHGIQARSSAACGSMLLAYGRENGFAIKKFEGVSF